MSHCVLFQLEALGELDALDKEQVNASRTIQQLKANIRQLENTRAQVRCFGKFMILRVTLLLSFTTFGIRRRCST